MAPTQADVQGDHTGIGYFHVIFRFLHNPTEKSEINAEGLLKFLAESRDKIKTTLPCGVKPLVFWRQDILFEDKNAEKRASSKVHLH